MTIHKVLTCPICHVDNSHRYWDSHTREQMGIKPAPEGHMLSSRVDKDTHAKFQTEFNCPTCNNRIKGVDLIDDGEVRV